MAKFKRFSLGYAIKSTFNKNSIHNYNFVLTLFGKNITIGVIKKEVKGMKNAEYLEAFTDYLLEEEKSKGTIEGYTLDLKEFLSFLGKDIALINRVDINQYKDLLKAKKLQTLTINRKLVSVKQFISFLNDRFLLGLTVRIKQEKIQQQYSLKDEELLSEEDFQALIKVVKESGDIRTEAMLKAMYYSGMRVSEMLQLRVDHVNSEKKIISDIKGKGGKFRDIYISNKLISILKSYLQVREQPFSVATQALFVGQRGPITRQTIHNSMKKYAALAGIPKEKAHAHNLRHLFGLRLAAKGVPIQEIAKYMGHTSIEVTKIYLEKPQSYYSDLIDQL
ncbi:tyrosine-type recombinase/integrase [Bacillus testis]|uniref:tyrosine-type recombinase/integrase n=1 Tax=Bacillus testis TaxID=1622072 RepID=UPI0009E5C966|nr:tyrosine-type recombinase/integrase [Bacillus testis]